MTFVESSLIASPAAAFLESVPFVLGAAVLQRLLPRAAWAAPYLGCGCGPGPPARSLPATALCWLLFGPWVSIARWCAATLLCHSREVDDAPRMALVCAGAGGAGAHAFPSALEALTQLWPPVLTAAAASLLAGVSGLASLPPLPAFALGMLAGIVAAPCALGVPAVAAALRPIEPAFAAGYLSTAGIVDLRFLFRLRGGQHGRHRTRISHDALAYGILALVCAIVALRHGAQIVHPFIALALVPCALAFAVLMWQHRAAANARLRYAPALMLAGTFLAAPPPEYHATETTLADAYAGERVDFTGVATQTRGVTTVVRFAITCCRADAAPVVVRLSRAQPALHGWVRVRGVIGSDRAGICLVADRTSAVTPPADPFVYR